MPAKSTTRKLFIWIAFLAVLLNALAPTVSHAVTAGRNAAAGWDICRAGHGPGLAPLAAPSGDSEHDRATLLQDCAYCAAHAGSQGLVPVTTEGLGMLGGHALRPPLAYHAPQPLLALAAAAPRGPPAHA